MTGGLPEESLRVVADGFGLGERGSEDFEGRVFHDLLGVPRHSLTYVADMPFHGLLGWPAPSKGSQWCDCCLLVSGLEVDQTLVDCGDLLVLAAQLVPAGSGDDDEDRGIQEHRQGGAVPGSGLAKHGPYGAAQGAGVLMLSNPCKAKSVKLPTAIKKKIIPWSLERVRAVIAGLPKRFQTGGKLAFGCGLRQGEVFGFAVEDIDFKGGWIHVNRQVRLVGTKPVFALPKGSKIRSVPLPAQLAAALKAHMKEFRPVDVTLPWAKPDGEPKSFRLLFVDKKGRAYNRSVFNMGDWKRALAAAGVIPPRKRGARYLQAAPEDGMHALRHAYASVLLDAGESIKALSEYLGHSDPGFTLRTYTHLLPSSETRTRKAIDDAFTEDPAPQGQGTSVPPAKPMCPQCALAA